MTIWVCPRDRSRLDDERATLRCTACGTSYAVVDGAPVFAASDRERETSAVESPGLVRLASLVRAHGWNEAIERLERSDPARAWPRRRLDWRSIVAPRADGPIVVVGSDLADDGDPPGSPGPTIRLVPNVLQARILRLRFGPRCPPVAVCVDPGSMPLPDRSAAGAIFDGDGLASFGLGGSDLGRLASELRRIVRPGGVVVAGGAGRLAGAFAAAAGATGPSSPLEQRVLEGVARRPPGAERIATAMRRAGFGRPASWAPIPDAIRPRLLLRLDDRRAVRYVLDALVRRNAPTVRAALWVASGLARAGALHRFVPYRFLVYSL